MLVYFIILQYILKFVKQMFKEKFCKYQNLLAHKVKGSQAVY